MSDGNVSPSASLKCVVEDLSRQVAELKKECESLKKGIVGGASVERESESERKVEGEVKVEVEVESEVVGEVLHGDLPCDE
ncbi:hypothetical protein HDU67_002079 [Dinochytrium kinnereticum]|nr:hypothetical protein HDU67_002079 [Dinochytrium kinnereticum]